MANHLKDFRKQFKLDPKADLQTVQLAVESVYEAQKIGYSYLSEIEPSCPKEGFRIHAFLNLMSRIYEHAQGMLVALATGSPTSCEALGRIVVEGSINLMYLAVLGNPSTLIAFLESWVQEHNKKLIEWNKRLQVSPNAERVGKMIATRQEAMDAYTSFLTAVKDQCKIEETQGSDAWPPNILKRFEALGRDTDYYESYHRLSGASHITGEDTLTYLMMMQLGNAEHAQKVGSEAWAYSTMMSRLVCTFFVDAVAACLMAYQRQDNNDLKSLRERLVNGAHKLAKSAGVPLPAEG